MQITVILALLTALVMAEGSEQWLRMPLEPVRTVVLLVGMLVIVGAVLHLGYRTLLTRLERIGWADRRAGRLVGRFDLLSNVFILLIYGALLAGAGWVRLVKEHLLSAEIQPLVLMVVLLLAPFVVMQLCKWYHAYPVNRFMRECLVAGQLAEGLAARPVWNRKQYMSFYVRHGLLIVLAPVFLMLLIKDVLGWALIQVWPSLQAAADGSSHWAVELISAAGALLVFVFAPLLLKMVWVTRVFPQGPLREKLQEHARLLKLSYHQLLLWDTYSAVSNAAVTGLLQQVRFVLLSDALVENMSDRQILAVFSHEAAHVKYHHIAFLIMYVMGSLLLLTAVLEGLGRVLAAPLQNYTLWNAYGEWLSIAGMAVVGIGWFLAFGWVSRRFERQADVYGALAVGEDLPAVQAGSGWPSYLCSRGAQAMAAALNRVAMLNGMSIHARSFRHGSIRSRMEYLQRLSLEQGALKRFMIGMTQLQAAIVTTLLLGVALSFWLWRTSGS